MTNWKDSSTLSLSGGKKPTEWAGSSTIDALTGRTFLSKIPNGKYQLRQSGLLEEVRMKEAVTGTPNYKIKVLRESGVNFNVVDETGLITPTSTVGGTSTFVLSPELNCKAGDWLAVYVDSGTHSVTSVVGESVSYRDGDLTTGQPLDQSFADVALEIAAYSLRPWLCATGDSIIEGRNDWDGGNVDPYENYWRSGGIDPYPTGADAEIMGVMARDHLTGENFEYQNHAKGGSGWNSSGFYIQWCVDQSPETILTGWGTNDVVAQTWSWVEGYLDAARLIIPGSMRWIIPEILPRTDLSDSDAAKIRTWNGNFATWAAANNAEILAVHDAFGQIRGSTGELDDLLSAYADQDGVHLSYTGVDAYAQILMNQIVPVLAGVKHLIVI
jgi:hypothetical protein